MEDTLDNFFDWLDLILGEILRAFLIREPLSRLVRASGEAFGEPRGSRSGERFGASVIRATSERSIYIYIYIYI